jgi:hypothetical protein
MKSSNAYDSPSPTDVAPDLRASPMWLFVVSCVLTFFMVDLLFYMNDVRWTYLLDHPFEYASSSVFATGFALVIGSVGVMGSPAPKQSKYRIAGRVIGGCCLGGAFVPSEPVAYSLQRLVMNHPQHNFYIFFLMLVICAAVAIVVERTLRRLTRTVLSPTP